jgi:hypothetical protein
VKEGEKKKKGKKKGKGEVKVEYWGHVENVVGEEKVRVWRTLLDAEMGYNTVLHNRAQYILASYLFCLSISISMSIFFGLFICVFE